MVTDQSCEQHPSILPLATLGGKAATSWALFFLSRLLSTILLICLTLMESKLQHHAMLKSSLITTSFNSLGNTDQFFLVVCFEHL